MTAYLSEYRMMQRFAWSINDSRVQDQLLASIRGSGAFHRFKATVYRIGIQDMWYACRGNAYAEIAREWCDAHGISVPE